MPSTIFYSWQADLPNKTNRGFIEDCLKKAIRQLSQELEVYDSPRSEIQIDKDTKGVPGSPAIVDTIFKKIDTCLIFVADISFVGMRRDGKRPMPNTNIMIEYGYAVKAKGHERIIKVMNTAFGGPQSSEGLDLLPFDMKHLRWPIQYDLPENADTKARKNLKADLIKQLKSHIAPMLDSMNDVEHDEDNTFEETQPGYTVSTFLADGEKLISQIEHSGEAANYYLKSPPHAFLRIIPTRNEYRYSGMKLKPLATENSPLPFLEGRLGPGTNWGANKYGFLIHNGGIMEGPVTRIVQIFKNGEVWAINTNIVVEHKTEKVIAPFEAMYTKCLEAYRAFLLHKLKIPYPYKFVAGITGIEDCRLAMPNPPKGRMFLDSIQGLCVEEQVVKIGIINADTTAKEALLPFFESVWDVCSINRPDFLYDEKRN